MPYSKIIELIAKATETSKDDKKELAKIYADIEYYLGYTDSQEKKKLFAKLTKIKKHLQTKVKMGYIKKEDALAESAVYDKVMTIIEKAYNGKIEITSDDLKPTF